MSQIVRVMLVVITVSFGTAFAQDRSNREFLKSIDAQKRADLISRHAYDIAVLEYFAIPGKFDIYEIDIDVLETQGETITITPFSGPPIEILSHGIERNPDSGGHVVRWTGEIKIPNSKQKLPLRLIMYVRSIDADGVLRLPDPNREYTPSQLSQENAVIPKESYLRRNEKLVYGFTGNSIQVPKTKARVALTNVNENLDFVVVYEIDQEKMIILGDGHVLRPDGTPYVSVEQKRRIEAYETHVEKVRREFGLPQNRE